MTYTEFNIESVIIRPVTSDDVERIVDLAIEFEEYLIEVEDTLVSDIPPKSTFRKYMLLGLGDPKHTFLVAQLDGTIIGFSDMWTIPDFTHGGQAAYLQNLFLTAQYRRGGIGKLLLDEMMKDAKLREAVAFHVNMKRENKPAIAFYIKNGINVEHKMLETRLE